MGDESVRQGLGARRKGVAPQEFDAVIPAEDQDVRRPVGDGRRIHQMQFFPLSVVEGAFFGPAVVGREVFPDMAGDLPPAIGVPSASPDQVEGLFAPVVLIDQGAAFAQDRTRAGAELLELLRGRVHPQQYVRALARTADVQVAFVEQGGIGGEAFGQDPGLLDAEGAAVRADQQDAVGRSVRRLSANAVQGLAVAGTAAVADGLGEPEPFAFPAGVSGSVPGDGIDPVAPGLRAAFPGLQAGEV